jgi:hypothetical protein
MIQIQLIGMSMISYSTEVHLSKCNSSWVVSTKQTPNFNIQTAAMFVFFVLTKMVLLKVVHPLKIISIQNFMVPRWPVQVLYPPQNFERPPFWNGWRFGDLISLTFLFEESRLKTEQGKIDMRCCRLYLSNLCEDNMIFCSFQYYKVFLFSFSQN